MEKVKWRNKNVDILTEGIANMDQNAGFTTLKKSVMNFWKKEFVTMGNVPKDIPNTVDTGQEFQKDVQDLNRANIYMLKANASGSMSHLTLIPAKVSPMAMNAMSPMKTEKLCRFIEGHSTTNRKKFTLSQGTTENYSLPVKCVRQHLIHRSV